MASVRAARPSTCRSRRAPFAEEAVPRIAAAHEAHTDWHARRLVLDEVAGMIVDSHAHVDEVPALGWMDPASALIGLMDEAGVDRAVVMTYTEAPAVNPNALEYLAQQIAQYPGRLFGYVGSTRGTRRRSISSTALSANSACAA